MFEEVGTIYSIFIILLYLTIIMDLINIFMVFKKLKTDKGEYCTYGIKWTKIFMGLFFGAIVLFFILTQQFSAYVMWIHLILAVLLFVVEGTNIFLKVKFGKKK